MLLNLLRALWGKRAGLASGRGCFIEGYAEVDKHDPRICPWMAEVVRTMSVVTSHGLNFAL